MSKNDRFRIIGDHPHKGDVVTIEYDEESDKYVGASVLGGPFMHLTTFERCIHGMKSAGGCYAESKFLRLIGDEE